MTYELILILVTVSSESEGKRISDALLSCRLAACVSIVPKVTSSYWWENSIQRSDETLLIAKSRAALLDEVVKCVKEHHAYTVPEIIAMGIAGGNEEYLEWVGKETQDNP